jgi:hypothetical protein
MQTIHFGWFIFFLGFAVALGACSSDGGSGGGGTGASAGTGGTGGSPDDTGGPSFVINSPLEGSTIAGTVWFSAQPASRRPITKVEFSAGGEPVAIDEDGSDGFRVFLEAKDFPEGELALRAVVEGEDGLRSVQTLTVNNVPNPPSSATVGEDGAVLGTTDGSVVIIPAGVAVGDELSVEALSQAEYESRTGVDLAALGIAYLGGQAVTGSRALNGPVSNLGAGFAQDTSEDQAIRQFTVYPDLDGDGAPELVVTNDASITPGGDILSDPLPISVIGEVASTTTTKSNKQKVLQGTVQVRQGEALTVDVYGFNPFGIVDPVATWSTSVAINTTPAMLSNNLDAAGQLFSAVCPPDQPPGFGTVTFSQETGSRVRSVRAEIEVLAATPPGGATGESTEQFIEEVVNSLENMPVPEPSEEVAESTVEELQKLKDGTGDKLREAQVEIEIIVENPTPEQEQALDESDLIFDSAPDPPDWDKSDDKRITKEEYDVLNEIIISEREAADRLRVLGDDVLAEQFESAADELEVFVEQIENQKLLDEDQDEDPDNDLNHDPPQKPDVPPAPEDDSPDPGEQITNLPALCGQPPPGGEGSASALVTEDSGAKGIGPKQLDGASSLLGRIVVRVDHEGSDNPIRTISDTNGYLYIPFFEEGKRFVATAFDRATGQTRTFEGVGPAYRDWTHLFFNFRTEDTVEICTPPEGYNKTWRGFVSNQWFEPLNWEPEGVPVSTDNAYICPDAIGQPNQTQDAITVNDLLVPEGARFTNSSPLVRVRVLGDLDATGGIDGSGPIILLGGSIKGTVHRVEVWEPSSLSGDTTITDRITITEVSEDDDDASLTLSGHTLAAQNFSCCSNGAVGLIMDDPADRLIVEGESRFRFSTGSTLSAGEIELRGDVLFCAGGLEVPFRSTGTSVVMSGQSEQSFSAISGCATGAPVFAELQLVAPANLTLNLPVQQSGDLLVPEGASIAYLGGSSNIFSTVGGDIDLSGSMTVDLPTTAKLSVSGTLMLNATGVLDDAGDIIVSACDPKDGTIVNVDPCP